MRFDSEKTLNLLRAILSGDVELRPKRTAASGLATFLAGLGTGVAVGLLFAPNSGEETRSRLTERARQGVEFAKEKGQELGKRAQESVGRVSEDTGTGTGSAKTA
jgi:gas vesicle protein